MHTMYAHTFSHDKVISLPTIRDERMQPRIANQNFHFTVVITLCVSATKTQADWSSPWNGIFNIDDLSIFQWKQCISSQM